MAEITHMGAGGLPAPVYVESCVHCNAACVPPQRPGVSPEILVAHRCRACGGWACQRCIERPECERIDDRVATFRRARAAEMAAM